MFIRYNNTAKYWEYDTSAAQSGAGPWVILNISGHPAGTLPANVAYIDRDNHFQFGQTITGGLAASTFVNGVDITGSSSVSGGRVDSRGSFGSFYSIDLSGPVNNRFWNIGQANHDGNLYFQTVDDGYVAQANAVLFRRDGSTRFSNYTEHVSGAYFPAVSSNPQVLDKYEEGSWTPSFQGAGGMASGQTYTLQNGTYMRIGRQVLATYGLALGNIGTGGAGQVVIYGYPYANGGIAFALNISYFSGILGAVSSLISHFAPSYPFSHVYYKNANSTGVDAALDYANLQNGTVIYGSSLYMVP